MQNFGLFQDMIKSQKIMSPAFPAGDCTLRLSVYQSSVNGVNYLSMCLESKDPDKGGTQDRSCWSLFRMSVLSQTQVRCRVGEEGKLHSAKQSCPVACAWSTRTWTGGKGPDKGGTQDRSCWSLFRLSVLSQTQVHCRVSRAQALLGRA